MIELEKTYLAKRIPDGLKACTSKEIIDLYIPKKEEHCVLRVRKHGDAYEITKKQPVENDPSKQREHTIPLTQEEFDALVSIDGKKAHKIRYYYPHHGRTFEIDVFQPPLNGLVLVDIEFDNEDDKDFFHMPDFCLADVTHELFVAGGMICGKTYDDIKPELEKYHYTPISMD